MVMMGGSDLTDGAASGELTGSGSASHDLNSAPAPLDSARRLAVLGRLASQVCQRPDLVELGRYTYGLLRELFSIDAFFLLQADQQSGKMASLLVIEEAIEHAATSVTAKTRRACVADVPPLFDADRVRIGSRLSDGRIIRSRMTGTMRIGNRLIGQIEALSAMPDAYTENDAVFLQTVANQLSMALEHERTKDEATISEAKLRDAIRLERRVRDSRTVDMVLRELAQGLVQVSGADAAIISLWESTPQVATPVAYFAAQRYSGASTRSNRRRVWRA